MQPPLGVMPKWLWIERRTRELAESIARFASTDELGNSHIFDPAVKEMAEELLEHVDWLRSNQPAPSIEEIERRMLR
ncbi:MAG: hypothetical protein KDE27_05470 [Planctomycetes bacterium]|nr:hypothetical protein [Planctomycetota bacterium]